MDAAVKLPIPDEQWPVFSALLDEVMERPQDEWAEWLSRLPAQHAELKPWLTKVLKESADLSTRQLLGSPALPADSLPSD